MPFDSKIAASYDADVLAIEPSVMENAVLGPAPDLARSGVSLYNLIKTVAKMEDASAAIQRLRAAASREGVDLDRKNSKGSTALHACAYLKRWDLAQAMMDQGASPLIKNAAGHTFFLCAVKDAQAPWRDLFARHPELVEKHQKYLDRARGKNGGKPASEQPTEVVSKILPVSDVGNSEGLAGMLVESKSKIQHLLELGRPVELSEVLAIERAFECMDLDLYDRIVSSLSSMDAAASLHVTSLSMAQGRHLIKRLTKHDDPAVFAKWIGASRKFLPVDGAMVFLTRLLANGRHEDIKEAVLNGFEVSEDFIEDCEEHGLYDLADFLIDYNSENRPIPASPGRSAQAGDGRQSKAKISKKGLPAKKTKNMALDKKRSAPKRSHGAKGAGRAAKIANLDGPLKEANEFEYREKTVPAKATIVIVKKARPIMQGVDE